MSSFQKATSYKYLVFTAAAGETGLVSYYSVPTGRYAWLVYMETQVANAGLLVNKNVNGLGRSDVIISGAVANIEFKDYFQREREETGGTIPIDKDRLLDSGDTFKINWLSASNQGVLIKLIEFKPPTSS